MRTIIAVAALVLAFLLVFLSQPLLAAIAIVVAVGLVAIGAMRKTGEARMADPTLEMDPDSRSLYAPVRRLTNELEALIQKNPDSSLLKTIGNEALREAQRIRDQVAEGLQVRSQLKRASRGRSLAIQEVDKLQAQISDAKTDGERAALQSALTARQLELGHYTQVEETIGRIDSGVRQAEAALSEMKARLAVGAGGEAAARASSVDDLRDTMSRLKALSLSVDEAEELLT